MCRCLMLRVFSSYCIHVSSNCKYQSKSVPLDDEEVPGITNTCICYLVACHLINYCRPYLPNAISFCLDFIVTR